MCSAGKQSIGMNAITRIFLVEVVSIIQSQAGHEDQWFTHDVTYLTSSHRIRQLVK